MGLEFIGRTLRTFGLVLLIFLPFGFYYFGLYATLAILSGAVWGIVNLIFLTELVKAIIRPGGVQVERAIVIGVVSVAGLKRYPTTCSPQPLPLPK